MSAGGREADAAALDAFVALCDAGRFWDAHEALEQVWRDSRSDFHQGLILWASAFVHAGRRNAHGVRAQLAKARARLAPYAPAHLGFDVQALLDNADRCTAALPAAGPPDWSAVRPLALVAIRAAP